MRPDPAGKTTKGSALQLWWAYPDDLLRAEAAEACAAALDAFIERRTKEGGAPPLS